ncbi:hypothetical protein FB451DRAFT_1238996, partial [Mycena latifolia]
RAGLKLRISEPFADVTITDKGVSTQESFLASDDLVVMFGAGVFGFVQADIKSNIASNPLVLSPLLGVRERYDGTPSDSTTLEDLVRQEHSQGLKHGTQCLVRLVRGLAFTCLALQTTDTEKFEAELKRWLAGLDGIVWQMVGTDGCDSYR